MTANENQVDFLRARYTGRRVLVIGGAGFLGSNIVLSLVSLGARVTVQDALIPGQGGNLAKLEEVEGQYVFHRVDIRDGDGTTECVRDQELIFNIAGQPSHAYGMRHPLEDLDVNARAQIHILEACRAVAPQATVVYCSSRHVYGRARYLPVDESHPVAPLDVYSINKFAGESYHRLYHDVYGLRTCSLRLTNTYGPRQNALDFVGVFMRKAATGQPLTVYGDGTQLRDFTYVADAVRAFVLAGVAEGMEGEVCNLGGPDHCSVREFAERLAVLAKVPVETVPFPPERAAIESGDYYASYERFRGLVGWTPRVLLSTGMARTLAYFQANLEMKT